MYTKEEKIIEEMFDKYCERVYEFAEEMFVKKILPYLKKYDLEYLAGNGTFFIFATEKTPEWFIKKYYQAGYCAHSVTGIDPDRIDKRISKILFSEVNGMRSNSLGSLMPSYSKNQLKEHIKNYYE